MMERSDTYDPQKIGLRRASDSVFEGGDSEEYLGRPHMCETCGKRFTLLENLNRHQMIHTNERPYVCNYCNKKFRLAQHLKEHIRIHTGEKPYKCKTCGRAFCQISNLKSHEKTHTKIKAFKCDICSKCFRRAFTLKQHKLTHTKGSTQSDTQATVNKSMPNSVYRPFVRKQNSPNHLLELAEHAMHRRRSLGDSRPSQLQQAGYLQRSGYGDTYPVSLTSACLSRPRMSPISAPARMTPPFVSPAAPGRIPQPSEEMLQCPSLSALLRTDCESREMAGYLQNGFSASDSGKPSDASGSVGKVQVPGALESNEIGRIARTRGDRDTNFSNALDYACVQCDRGFANETELRNHTIREHNRKNQRRDSAYSSHSDKSPTSPGAGRKPVSAGDCCLGAPTRSHYAEDEFMKRVHALALRSLGRVGGTDEASAERVENGRRSEVAMEEGGISLEVGSSPTEAGGDQLRDMSDNRDQDSKVARRGFGGSKKWKRELCKEWYEIPQQETRQNDGAKSTASLAPQPDPSDEPLRKRLREEYANQTVSDTNKDAENADKNRAQGASKTANEPPTQLSAYQRFAPIVEWKPVVTGWKDMVSGTLYAYPPHAQQSYLQSLYDPRVLLSNSSVSSAETMLSSVTDENSSSTKEASPRFFRFSPHILADLAADIDSLPPSASDSALSSVYAYAYPPDALPMPGYSRLQHALLHRWDPNRHRLGGTSSVPQTPNLVSAT